MAYQCPLCQLPLQLDSRSYRCDNNHQFDKAKEGYVNLMPAHHKRSKDPGDNKEMTQARRRFLETEHYHPMRDKVAQLCRQFLPQTATQLLDIGCGEGYYTTELANQINAQHQEAQVYGLDISKVAVRYAAKRYPNVDFSVASSHRLPFGDNSLDGIVRIYAPCKVDELQRCIKTEGIMVTVTPAGRHLFQLREGIYNEVRLHSEDEEALAGFELAHQEILNYTMPLSGQEASDLLQMTPFAWKATDEFRAQLAAATIFECEADFMIRVYRKQA